MINEIVTIDQLAKFLHMKRPLLVSLNPGQYYHTFQINKPGSDEKRTIEAPFGSLKSILNILSGELQWYYYYHKTEAAHGFVLSPEHDPDKRNILSNAKTHLNMRYLLNMDLDNFFYQVDHQKLRNVFGNYNLFAFDKESEKLLIQLVTLHGRLPMGSSSSPALSNFATIDLDNELLSYTRQVNINYTRYVDDLSFSSQRPINDNHYQVITSILQSHRFLIDPHKTKWFGENQTKEVTGLIVGEEISIPDIYLKDLEKQICRLKEVCSFVHIAPDYNVFEWIEKMKRALRGRVAFVRSIYGKNDSTYRRLKANYDSIWEELPEEESVSWRYIGYEFYD